MINEVSERERALKERIRAGAGEMQDYFELADILHERGGFTEALTIVKQALALDLTPDQRGFMLYEEAHLLSLTAGQDDEVLALAKQALSLLGEQHQTPEFALSAINAAEGST